MNDLLENLALARFQQLIGWAGVLVTMGAAVIAASYLRRSRWAAAVAAGFGLMTVNHIAAQLLIPWIIRSNPSDVGTRVGMASFGTSVVGLIALATLVFGVMGTLSELSRVKGIREP